MNEHNGDETFGGGWRMWTDGVNSMMQQTFNAFLVTKTDDHQFTTSLVQRVLDDLPQGDVLIRVHYSSLNRNVERSPHLESLI